MTRRSERMLADGLENARQTQAASAKPARAERRALPYFASRLFKPISIRVALALLVFSVMLPTSIFFALQYRAAISEKQREIELQARNLTRDIAGDIAYEIAIRRTQLDALALSNRLHDNDLAGFYE